MMEAIPTSETSVGFYETTQHISQEAVIFILAAVRARRTTHPSLLDASSVG
jgi:hypothetical protein